jgi:hypothetical protein
MSDYHKIGVDEDEIAQVHSNSSSTKLRTRNVLTGAAIMGALLVIFVVLTNQSENSFSSANYAHARGNESRMPYCVYSEAQYCHTGHVSQFHLVMSEDYCAVVRDFGDNSVVILGGTPQNLSEYFAYLPWEAKIYRMEKKSSTEIYCRIWEDYSTPVTTIQFSSDCFVEFPEIHGNGSDATCYAPQNVSFHYAEKSGDYCDTKPGKDVYGCASDRLMCDIKAHKCKCKEWFCDGHFAPLWDNNLGVCVNVVGPDSECTPSDTFSFVDTVDKCSGALQCIDQHCKCASEEGKCNGRNTAQCSGCLANGEICQSNAECVSESCSSTPYCNWYNCSGEAGVCNCHEDFQFFDANAGACKYWQEGDKCINDKCGGDESLTCVNGTCQTNCPTGVDYGCYFNSFGKHSCGNCLGTNCSSDSQCGGTSLGCYNGQCSCPTSIPCLQYSDNAHKEGAFCGASGGFKSQDGRIICQGESNHSNYGICTNSEFCVDAFGSCQDVCTGSKPQCMALVNEGGSSKTFFCVDANSDGSCPDKEMQPCFN